MICSFPFSNWDILLLCEWLYLTQISEFCKYDNICVHALPTYVDFWTRQSFITLTICVFYVCLWYFIHYRDHTDVYNLEDHPFFLWILTTNLCQMQEIRPSVSQQRCRNPATLHNDFKRFRFKSWTTYISQR